jgi:excisionase family DNA binding protein
MSPTDNSLRKQHQVSSAQRSACSLCEAQATNRFLNEEHAALYSGVSRSWLRQLRHKGGGPAYHKLGRRVLYERAALDEWLAAHRVVR